jgi:hypothetical protein
MFPLGDVSGLPSDASSLRSYFLKYRLDVLDEGGEFSGCVCISPFLFMPREVAGQLSFLFKERSVGSDDGDSSESRRPSRVVGLV